ncbi:PAS domain-containing protein [Desulfovibrio aminophilus]|uniref:helix-turn-helix transcriptional regulator n=1 Tax=Desulfovibrio aminophilus TaxID=81425 RepID=UPI003395BCDF
MARDGLISIIERFIPLVDFLGSFLGEDCEVILHDVRNPERSVLAIANGHVSGRRVGSPITDLALRVLRDDSWRRQDWINGYKALSREGRLLHSSTYFIKDDGGELAGMLCLNMDATSLLEARDLLERFVRRANLEKTRPEPETPPALETLAESLEELTGGIIRQAMNGSDMPIERMNSDEKIAVVRALNEKGVFLLKGAVAVVARHLAVSEATVYRYLQRVAA